MKNLFIIICSLLFVWMTGCGSARKTEPIKEPLNLATEKLVRGQKAFERHCNTCHPRGDSGLGPALNNKDIVPNFLLKFQVRNGLGAMPSISDKVLPDEDLDAIVEYINALQEK